MFLCGVWQRQILTPAVSVSAKALVFSDRLVDLVRVSESFRCPDFLLGWALLRTDVMICLDYLAMIMYGANSMPVSAKRNCSGSVLRPHQLTRPSYESRREHSCILEFAER